MKYYLKKGVSLLLSVVMFGSVTFNSFAIQDSASGGDGSSTVTWGSDWGNDPGRSGIRISLVDVNDPTKVVSIDKEHNPRVVDIIFGSEAQFNAHAYSHGRKPTVFTGVKTQTITENQRSEQPNQLKQIFLSDYLKFIANEQPDMYKKIGGEDLLKTDSNGVDGIAKIRWMWNTPGTASYTLRGKELRDWLISNNNGVITEIIGGSVNKSVTTMPDGTEKEIPKSNNSSKRSNGASSTKGWKTGTIGVANKNEKKHEAEWWYINQGEKYIANAKNAKTATEVKYISECGTKWYKSSYSMIGCRLKQKSITATEYKAFSEKIESINRQIKSEVSSKQRAINDEKRLNSRIGSIAKNEQQGLLNKIYNFVFNPITAYAAELGNGNVEVTEGLPGVAENDGTGQKKQEDNLLNHLSYLMQFLDEDNVPYFMTEDSFGKTVMENGIERPMNIFDPLKGEHTVDFKILVEPIDFFTPYQMDGKTPIVNIRFYGTLTNIVQAFEVYGVNKYYLNDGWSNHVNRNTFNRLSWYAMTVADDPNVREDMFNGNYIFDNVGTVITEFGKSYRSGIDVVPNAVLYKSSLPYDNGEGRLHQAGWGVQVYWPEAAEPNEGTNTWDSENYSDGTPGPSPEVLDEELSKYTKKIKVAKWYYLYDEISDTEMVTDVKLQEDSGTPISIVNEGNYGSDIYWEVEGWSTGFEDKVPSNDDVSSTFEEYSDGNLGTYAGTEPEELIINVDDPDKVLYVKLVQHILPTKTVDIVKVFDKSNGTNPDIKIEAGVDITSDGYDATDPDGKYIEHIQSEEGRKEIKGWDDVLDYGICETSNPIIKDEQAETIYIHYGETVGKDPITDKQPLILHEDELSHGYTLKNLHTDGSLSYIQEKFANKNYSMSLCDGHDCGGEDCSGRHGRSQSHKAIIEDNRYKLSVTSLNNNPNFIADYIQDGGSWSLIGYKSLSGGNTDKLQPNARFLLYRNKTKDTVTLYPDKNDSTIKGLLAHIGVNATGATPQTSRVAQTGSGKFKDTLNINFSEAGDYDRTLSWKWICSYRGRTEGSDSWDSTFVGGQTLSALNSSYNFDNNVETHYELGTVGNGTTAPQSTRSADFASVFYNNPFVSVQKDGDIKLYPYIQMVYNDRDSESKRPVLVTSTNLSTIGAFTKVESGVWKNGAHDDDTVDGSNPEPNVMLDSTQWSTHKNSLDFMTNNSVYDKKSVLPGGSTFDVSMGKANQDAWDGLADDKPTTSTKLGYRVWQTCIEDSRLGLLAPDSTAPSVSEAKQKVTELDNSIKADIPKYGLVQMITKGAVDYRGYMGTFTTRTEYSAVVNGSNWNGIPLSTDAKYYLKLVSTGSGDEFNSTVTNFDVLKGGIQQQTLYTVGSDTEGNVYVLLNGTEIGRIGSTEAIPQLLSKNNEIRLLDENTKVVTNYINSIDRNKGSNRNGKAWYNEAFDGINVLYSYLSYDIGFGNSIVNSPGAGNKGTAIRSAVLDTKLTGQLANKADLYNFNVETQNEKIRSSMILTGQTGVAGGLAAPSGEMGTLALKNGNTIMIKLGNMPIFAYSKMFYIPNANVSDLN